MSFNKERKAGKRLHVMWFLTTLFYFLFLFLWDDATWGRTWAQKRPCWWCWNVVTTVTKGGGISTLGYYGLFHCWSVLRRWASVYFDISSQRTLTFTAQTQKFGPHECLTVTFSHLNRLHMLRESRAVLISHVQAFLHDHAGFFFWLLKPSVRLMTWAEEALFKLPEHQSTRSLCVGDIRQTLGSLQLNMRRGLPTCDNAAASGVWMNVQAEEGMPTEKHLAEKDRCREETGTGCRVWLLMR